MKKFFEVIFFSVLLAMADEGRVVDTLFVDSHKVTYVDESSLSDDRSETDIHASVIAEAQTLKDSSGNSAPPNARHRISAEIVVQNWAPAITYEFVLADFWSIGVRFNYSYFSKKNIASYTDVEGELAVFSVPLFVRCYFGRFNGKGASQVIDASGKNHVKKQKSQMEIFLQLRVDPSFYQVDLVDVADKKRLFPRNENGIAIALGLGTRFLGDRFFWGPEVGVGRFFKKPQFMNGIEVYKDVATGKLENIYIETILSVGFMF